MSNLLDKSSILLTPTAYNNGKILSVKPNTSVGDFDFTRNSSATRVNSQGLIEDVQILSSNLVTNGDFSQEGSEEVTNGDFATDSNWNKGANWSILNGVATSNGSGLIQQSTSELTSGKTYKISFEITEYTSGGVKLYSGSGSDASTYKNTVGTHTDTLVLNGSTTSLYSNNFIGSIDNVSVKEVGQDWTLGTGWSIGTNKVIGDGTMGGNDVVRQLINFSQGTTYRFSFTVLDYVSGGVFVRNPFNGYLDTASANGSYTFDYVAGINDYIDFRGNSFVGSISNISVLEITSDTNLPRIDYTGGDGHWLFEPQSTNLIPYSEDFTQWNKVNGVVVISNFSISPDGTQNASKVVYNGTSSGRLEISTSASGTNTQSIYLKTDSGTQAVSIGSSTSGITEVIVTSQWKRFTYTGTGSYPRVLCNDAATIYIWGAQFEQSSFATSYIPTNGSTVTRLQDAASGAGSSDLINSTGVLYAEIAALADDLTNRFISLTDGTDSNSVTIFYGGVSNRIRTEIKSGAVTQANLLTTSYPITNYNKIAISYAENNFALWVNGVEVATDTSGSTPIGLNNLSFNRANILTFFGKTKCVAVFEALTDAELTCLTTI